MDNIDAVEKVLLTAKLMDFDFFNSPHGAWAPELY
jgi:hypothetical protein